MGLIHIDLFTTLDGVAQAPGGPDEDTEGGFAFGGWQAPLFDEMVGEQVIAGMEGLDALLLGRRTYDIFAGFWPDQDQGDRCGHRPTLQRRAEVRRVAGDADARLGRTPRCSAPTSPTAVGELRERHEHVHVIGSLDFVQTLLAGRGSSTD